MNNVCIHLTYVCPKKLKRCALLFKRSLEFKYSNHVYFLFHFDPDFLDLATSEPSKFILVESRRVIGCVFKLLAAVSSSFRNKYVSIHKRSPTSSITVPSKDLLILCLINTPGPWFLSLYRGVPFGDLNMSNTSTNYFLVSHIECSLL